PPISDSSQSSSRRPPAPAEGGRSGLQVCLDGLADRLQRSEVKIHLHADFPAHEILWYSP
ncbi:MAG TPA: hypothetical protein P5233_02415, partial [Candidatus Paceibacterota bacterium]|nr:hypothetical protein [Candidatus Paceibacterota bacterium]